MAEHARLKNEITRTKSAIISWDGSFSCYPLSFQDQQIWKLFRNTLVASVTKSAETRISWRDTRESILERNLTVVRSVRRDLIPERDWSLTKSYTSDCRFNGHYDTRWNSDDGSKCHSMQVSFSGQFNLELITKEGLRLQQLLKDYLAIM